MSALTDISPSSVQIASRAVHGSRLDGIWRMLGIGPWIVLFLISLSASFMSISYADLWFRTPYTELIQLDPVTPPAFIEQSIKLFQEAIFDLGLSLEFYAHYFTSLRILAGLPFFILSILIIRRRSDRLMNYFQELSRLPVAVQPETPFPELTTRELDVLRLIAQGRNNAEIANNLVISPKTVRNHITSIFSKLQVADRAQAIILARRAGLE